MYWKRLESKKTPRGGPTIRYLSSTSSFDASRQQRLMGAPSPSDFPIAATLPMQSSEMLSSPPQSLSLSSVRGLRHASGNSMLPVISSAVRTQPLLPPEPRFPRAALDAPPSAWGACGHVPLAEQCHREEQQTSWIRQQFLWNGVLFGVVRCHSLWIPPKRRCTGR